MKTRLLLCAALLAAPFLRAQEDHATPEMPNPKTEAHEALAMFVGDWTSTCKMHAMPDVPGREQAMEVPGTERSELLCNGLWLKTTIRGSHEGESFEGVWLVGYDPTTRQYRGIWVSSMDQLSMECDGTYDAATKTWTFAGDSPQGPFRSVTTFADADHFTEVVYTVEGGQEVEGMRMERTRQKGAARAIQASTPPQQWPSPRHELLAKGVGDWQATSTFMIPGMDPIVEQCSERVVPVCGGKWFWSDFTGAMMGQPFRGHALTGWDEQKEQYVCWWIDSTVATPSRTRGSHDPSTNVWTFAGECLDPVGRPMTIHQTSVQKDADTRDLQVSFEGAEGRHEMKIHYVRKPK